jgi:voltage-gated potassium channel Kch
LYFLWLVYVSIVGYALAYQYLQWIDPGAFQTLISGSGLINWLYFSAVTTATVGFGDIVPKTEWAQALTLSQILTGPLLLSWLIAVFLGIRTEGA